MEPPQIVHVGIGEVKIGRNQDILKAILGSCVGIGMLWSEKKLYALAHCLLPEAPAGTPVGGARFVDQAVRSLVGLLKIKPEDHSSIQTVLVGGGNMTAPRGADTKQLVGTVNYETAKRVLKEQKFQIYFLDVGGDMGRRIQIDCSNGLFNVKKIPRFV